MKYTCLILLWSLFATMALPADNLIQSISIVPCPESITPGTGYFTFSGKTDFTVENEEQAEVARCFSALFTQAAGFTPSVKVGEKKGKISFLTDDALKSEAYHLEITPRQIIVKASDTKGFFYALQTIRQLLPASIEGTAVAETADWSVPAMTIKDEPRFGYRGLMVDVARFFIPKENLLRIIDCMGMLKINTLHLHLVDDNGWRIEIKRYPLLTEIGSRRVDRPGKSFPERRNPRQGEPTVEKGFYTQEDIREIVAYAARHQVEVIPEIEMPAHSNAALASYPLLACPVVDKFIGVLPGLGGNHADVIFCAGNDSVFTFLQGVIDEVVELFPSRYIHLGGDEARKTHWKECPLCQERMRQEGLEDEEALQGYFMARMSKYVQSKGKEAMGWDELTNTRIPDGAIIYGWRGYGQAAVKAAEQGHRFVMTLLTEIGSRRVDRPGKSFPERRNPRQGEPTVEKGFYTQEDIREIVAYAARHQVEVIPEIEMPAHSNAALASYPLLACPVVDKFIGVLPGLGGNHADVIFCAGNDSVFTFLQGVIDEVVELFPSRYIHLGGDEARKTHWKECPLCQERMRQEGLEDEEALQGYFMARMSKYVQSKGKEAMGWDELTNTRIPDGAIIYGWRGYGQAAVKAAEQGHRFVMTPARIMYLIRYQGPQWFEPLTYFGNNTLKDVYRYEPIQKEWSPEVRSLLMGVQASMWTEFCNKPEDVEYQLFPRLAALAEVAWTQPWHKNWRSFLVAMDKFNEHLSAKGIVFACSMYNIQHTVTPVNGKLQVKLECERPDVEIRYTMDGKEPTDRSPLYKNPLMVTGTQTIKCTTYRAGRQMGKTLTLPLVWNKATAKPVLGNTQAGKILVNGIRGSLRQSDFEWHSWESSDSVAFTIDLQKKESLRSVSVGCITNYGMAAHKPADIEVWVSNDNRDYRKVSGKQFTDGEIFREGTFKEDVVLDLNKEIGRYVRIIAKGAGECPATHVRPGQEARIYFDEVMIE